MAGATEISATLGPVLFGVIVSALLTGIALLQAYIYYQRYPKDPTFLKTVVGVVIFSQVLAQISMTVTAYSTFISSWGVSMFELFPYTFPVPLAFSFVLGAIPAHIVEAYFIFRLHALIGKYWISISLWTVVAGCFGFIVGITVAGVTRTLDFSDTSSHVVGGVFLCAAVVDLATASLLCWYMTTRSRVAGLDMETMHLLRKLAVYSLETGALTSVVAVIIAVLVHTTAYPIYLTFFMNLSGLFSNSLFASLNRRQRIRESAVSSESFKRVDSIA